MVCIVCSREHQEETVEHVIPRSMGNIHYILRRGKVCSSCNNRFARFENIVVNSEDIYQERYARSLVTSKRQTSRKNVDDALVLFLIKMAYEGIQLSRPHLLSASRYMEMRDKLTMKKSHEFKVIKEKNLIESKPIPHFMDRFRLRRNGMTLNYRRLGEQFWVHFGYGKVNYVLRLF